MNKTDQQLVEEFLKNGGKIQKIAEGESCPEAVKTNKFVRKKDREPKKED